MHAACPAWHSLAQRRLAAHKRRRRMHHVGARADFRSIRYRAFPARADRTERMASARQAHWRVARRPGNHPALVPNIRGSERFVMPGRAGRRHAADALIARIAGPLRIQLPPACVSLGSGQQQGAAPLGASKYQQSARRFSDPDIGAHASRGPNIRLSRGGWFKRHGVLPFSSLRLLIPRGLPVAPPARFPPMSPMSPIDAAAPPPAGHPWTAPLFSLRSVRWGCVRWGCVCGARGPCGRSLLAHAHRHHRQRRLGRLGRCHAV